MRSTDKPTNARIRQLRRTATDAETVLWSCLRNRALNGHKFIRQAPVGSYIADFLCRSAGLIVEADGSQHDGSRHDSVRDDWLNGHGCSVLRLANSLVLQNRDVTLETIVAALERRLTPCDTPEVKFKLAR
jgi:very-short-patch-repair endonuclease